MRDLVLTVGARARRAWKGLRSRARRGAELLRDPVGRRRFLRPRLNLGTRFLLVLLFIVTASTAVTLVIQDNALKIDLETAARARLAQARAIASQLLDEHLAVQVSRYQAIAATPQFTANVEARHVPTLLHFADELAAQQNAAAIVFLGSDGQVLARSGDAGFDEMIRRELRGWSDPGPDAARADPLATYAEQQGTIFSLAGVPLRGADHPGLLVSLEPLPAGQLDRWSKLCRARVELDPEVGSDDLSLLLRPVGARPLRVVTSFEAERNAVAHSRENLLTGGLLGLALAAAASILLARQLVRPIRAIQTATERVAGGEFDFRLDADRSDEVGDVARACNFMLDRLEQNINHRIRAENEVNRLSFHDGLTGLANRRLLHQRLGAALDEALREGAVVAALSVDLDRFKDVNETLGHSAGDEMLREVARRLSACLWQAEKDRSRTRDSLLMARLSGDEFALVVPRVGGRADLADLAGNILQSLAEPLHLRGREVIPGASIGIAVYPDDARDAETLLRHADMAMVHAKNQGGNLHQFYTDSMPRIAARRLALESDLKRALEEDEFELYYQPKVNLSSGLVVGVEALLRWRTPDGSLVSPADFIPLAEETGAIVAIGEWVLRRAVRQAMEWQQDGVPSVRVAVNVSARQVEERSDLVSLVAELLAESGLDPRLLDLEITEGALLRDEEGSVQLFERLRALGVGLSLDDFGTGYSSLSYLRRLPVDTLKVDRSFVPVGDSNAADAALIGSIIAMAKVLNLKVVVEGVETWKQRRFLEAMGCDEIQGFVFSKPVDAVEAAAILRKRRLSMRRPKKTKTGRRSRSGPRQAAPR